MRRVLGLDPFYRLRNKVQRGALTCPSIVLYTMSKHTVLQLGVGARALSPRPVLLPCLTCCVLVCGVLPDSSGIKCLRLGVVCYSSCLTLTDILFLHRLNPEFLSQSPLTEPLVLPSVLRFPTIPHLGLIILLLP